MSFNYLLICSCGCKEGKRFKIYLQKYSDEGDCLFTDKKK